MKKTTLNPFENAKRSGIGGVSPSVIEEMQEEISVLGSQNKSQAHDITDIKAQLEELAGAYSTTEHKTGRKWIDGEDIYEKVIEYEGALGDTAATLASDIDYISNIVNALCISDGVENSYACSFSPITVWIDGTNNLKGRSLGNFTSQSLHIVIEYTKEATEE